MTDKIKEILDKLNKNKNEIKDYCYYPDDVLSCDDLIKLLDYITNLQETKTNMEQELQELYLIKDNLQEKIDKAIENCKKSIESINEKLKNNKEPFEVVDGKIICLNDYQVCRLKAIRMKSKELLNILEKENRI